MPIIISNTPYLWAWAPPPYVPWVPSVNYIYLSVNYIKIIILLLSYFQQTRHLSLQQMLHMRRFLTHSTNHHPSFYHKHLPQNLSQACILLMITQQLHLLQIYKLGNHKVPRRISSSQPHNWLHNLQLPSQQREAAHTAKHTLYMLVVYQDT